MKNINSKNKLPLILSIFLILLVLYIFYINNFTIDINNSTQINSNQTKLSSNQISIEHLIGTCPRSRQCTMPSCSLWSDINNDGICDRAIQ